MVERGDDDRQWSPAQLAAIRKQGPQPPLQINRISLQKEATDMTDNKLLPVPLTAEQIEWAIARLVEVRNDTGVAENGRLANEIIQAMGNSLARQGGR